MQPCMCAPSTWKEPRGQFWWSEKEECLNQNLNYDKNPAVPRAKG